MHAPILKQYVTSQKYIETPEVSLRFVQETHQVINPRCSKRSGVERALRQSGTSPVITFQGRVTRAPRRLRMAGAGHGELRPADRLLAPGFGSGL